MNQSAQEAMRLLLRMGDWTQEEQRWRLVLRYWLLQLLYDESSQGNERGFGDYLALAMYRTLLYGLPVFGVAAARDELLRYGEAFRVSGLWKGFMWMLRQVRSLSSSK